MHILAIETSCDETAIALVEATGGLRSPRFRVKKNIISSQVSTHRPYGGVVPNLAKREHLKNLPIVFKKLVPKPYTLHPSILAVTVGPGLEPALWTGIEFAKVLHRKHFPQTKLVGVNHLEGHLSSFLLGQLGAASFPAVSLIASGGHTILLCMSSLAEWRKLGETRDDAAGEAFDKVARLLGLPYPGGPEIERLARRGDPAAIPFPRPMLHAKSYDFSFSGLKTAVLYYLRDQGVSHWGGWMREVAQRTLNPRPQTLVANVAASFQAAAIDVLVLKTIRAARACRAKSIMLSGGVAANQCLRQTLRRETKKIGAAFLSAAPRFQGDNAAMIAVAGYLAHLRGARRRLAAQGNLNL